MNNTMTDYELVSKAYQLHHDINGLSNQRLLYVAFLEQEEQEVFKNPPPKPSRGIAEFVEPEIHYEIKPLKKLQFFSGLAFFYCIVGVMANVEVFAVPLIISVTIWLCSRWYNKTYIPKEIESNKNRIRNSPYYNQRLIKAREEHSERQKQLDAQFDRDVEFYNSKTYPEYLQELEAWNVKHEARLQDNRDKIQKIDVDVETKRTTLQTLYQDTKRIPPNYQTECILECILKILESTDYDIKTALEIYDRQYLKLQAERKVLAIQKQTEHLRQQNDHLEYQNELAYAQAA